MKIMFGRLLQALLLVVHGASSSSLLPSFIGEISRTAWFLASFH
jgi:hypothetical protein